MKKLTITAIVLLFITINMLIVCAVNLRAVSGRMMTNYEIGRVIHLLEQIAENTGGSGDVVVPYE